MTDDPKPAAVESAEEWVKRFIAADTTMPQDIAMVEAYAAAIRAECREKARHLMTLARHDPSRTIDAILDAEFPKEK